MPASSVTLVEARQRRASFLRAVVRELDLLDTEVINQRLEALVPTLAGTFDAAVMRCAGAPDHLLPLTLPLVRSGGMVVASGPPVRGQGRDVRHGRGRRDTEGSVPEFERVVVSGIDGTPRQFLVARKS
jgi:16S rRNA G527 N7-methylase RsmG